MDPKVKAYLSALGRRGGRASRRRLTPEAARDMVKVREARRAYRELHAQCFWSHDPNYEVTLGDVPWVAERIMRYGGRRGWEWGAKLCR
ncbi:MAG TPA: hypothetical protein PKA88_00820 [Polyangiaceae bacterium]|nr:hypothetical protein [Polyangiaceae bacterium]